MFQWLRGLLIVAVAGLAASVASGLAFAQEPTPTAPPLSACPTEVTLTVSPPSAAAPTTVTVSLSQTLNIKPATASDPTSFHLHYFVDTEATAAGQPIPTGNPKIIHSASTTQDLGALTAGQHTVAVVLGQLNHTACALRGSVTFTTAALPATGSGGDLGDGSSGMSVTTLLAIAGASLAALCLATALLMRRRHG